VQLRYVAIPTQQHAFEENRWQIDECAKNMQLANFGAQAPSHYCRMTKKLTRNVLRGLTLSVYVCLLVVGGGGWWMDL
jgi:hypothetical protein